MEYLRKLGVPMTRLTDPAAQRTLEDAVAAFADATRFPIAFGGYEHDGGTTVTAVTGNRTPDIQGMRVQLQRGLGGRAMSELRPRFAANYAAARNITHDYDPQILGEGIVALFAMPVVLGETARAVLYGGTRGEAPPSSSFVQAAASVAAELATEIRVQDRVLVRLGEIHEGDAGQLALPGHVQEDLRRVHADLRGLSSDVTDPLLRARLAAIETQLTAIGRPPEIGEAPIHLSRRETDVVAHAALGKTNAEIGLALALAESTVKSYLNTAMGKLDASTRHAAVAEARRLGLIL